MYALIAFEGTGELFVTPSRNVQVIGQKSILNYNGAKFGIYVCGYFESREIAKKVQLDLEHQYRVVLTPIRDLPKFQEMCQRNLADGDASKVKRSATATKKSALPAPIEDSSGQSLSAMRESNSSDCLLNKDSLISKDKTSSVKKSLFNSVNQRVHYEFQEMRQRNLGGGGASNVKHSATATKESALPVPIEDSGGQSLSEMGESNSSGCLLNKDSLLSKDKISSVKRRLFNSVNQRVHYEFHASKVKRSATATKKSAIPAPVEDSSVQSLSEMGESNSSDCLLNKDALIFKDKIASVKKRLFSSVNQGEIQENGSTNGGQDVTTDENIESSEKSKSFEDSITDMYALIAFEGTGELFVTPSRNIRVIGQKSILNYNGAKFGIYVCGYFESREIAKKVQLDLQHRYGVVLSPIRDLPKFQDMCRRNLADRDASKVKRSATVSKKTALPAPVEDSSSQSLSEIEQSDSSECLLDKNSVIFKDKISSVKKGIFNSANQSDIPENCSTNGGHDVTNDENIDSSEKSKSFEDSTTDMYALTAFEGTGELFVTPSRNIQVIEGKSVLNCNGAKIDIHVCGYFESREIAKIVQWDLEHRYGVVLSPIRDLPEFQEICHRNLADRDVSKVKRSATVTKKSALPVPTEHYSSQSLSEVGESNSSDSLLNEDSLMFKDKISSVRKRLFSCVNQNEASENWTPNGGHDDFTAQNIDNSEQSNSFEDSITERTSGNRYTKWKSKKQHACFYCGRLIKNITRHLQMVHYKEDRVRDALFAKRTVSGTHRTIFELLRKDGDANHNLKPNAKEKIMVRTSNKQYVKEVACPYCKGFFSNKNINRHISSVCKGEKIETFGNIQGTARIQAAAIDPVACEELVKHIYPYLTKESQRNILIKDPTAISFGNLLIDKHFLTNLGGKHIHISQQLRLLADIFNACKAEAPELTEIKDMFHPKYYPTIINAIKKRARYSYGMFDVPSAATSSCTLLCKVIEHLKSNAILSSDATTEELLTKIEYLITRNRNNSITKMAGENQTQRQRAKVEVLPTTAEINQLMKCLDIEFNEAYKEAKHTFNLRNYSRLCKAILANIMVFNRKRPGDCQKTLVIEYRNMSTVDKEHLNKLCEQDKNTAVNFSRFLAQGKLNKKASNLLCNSFKDAINFFLDRRTEIGVEHYNKYLFANPKGKRYPFFKADEALYTICKQYKLNYSKLTANKLRKHLATSTSLLPSETQTLISDFMGHSMGIHKNIYQQRQVQTEVITIAKVLQDCAGISNEGESSGSRLSSDNEGFPQLNNNHRRSTDNTSSFSINEDKLGLSTIMESEDDNDSTQLISNVTDLYTVAPQNDNCFDQASRSRTFRRVLRPTKKTWSTPERRAVRVGFEDYINKQTVPSIAEIDRLLAEKKMKLYRPSHVIRAWIAADIKKRNLLKRRKIQGWNTPQKHKLRECFKKYFDIVRRGGPRQYPPTYEIHMAIERHPELQEKKHPMILSKLQHEFGLIEKQLQKRRES